MRIATWNINGVRARVETLERWLKEQAPDVVCLQEIKCQDDSFPVEIPDGLSYNHVIHGQKSFNGVAVLSKHPIEVVRRGLPDFDDGAAPDEQARYLEVLVLPKDKPAIRVASIYLPNGNPIGTEKFDYKLRFMRRLEAHIKSLLELEEILLLGGDYNVIPEADDVHDPAAWAGDALFQPVTRANFRRLLNLGLTDAFSAIDGRGHQYTFWDYQAGAWQKDNGIRIDHWLLSPFAADRLQSLTIDRMTRAWDKPSDHVPVIVEVAV